MSESIQVAIIRTVKPGCEADFEKALHAFVQKTLLLSGQMGVHVLRPPPGSDSRQYGIVRRFADRDALNSFRSSPEYLEWSREVAQWTEGSSQAQEFHGLESWLTLPGAPLRPLPQWKMAIATYLGVVPVTLFLALTIGRLLQSWSLVLNNLVFNFFVVALLTWVVMPLLTRVLHRWLHP